MRIMEKRLIVNYSMRSVVILHATKIPTIVMKMIIMRPTITRAN